MAISPKLFDLGGQPPVKLDPRSTFRLCVATRWFTLRRRQPPGTLRGAITRKGTHPEREVRGQLRPPRAMRVVDAAMAPLYFAMVSYGGADEDLSRLQR